MELPEARPGLRALSRSPARRPPRYRAAVPTGSRRSRACAPLWLLGIRRDGSHPAVRRSSRSLRYRAAVPTGGRRSRACAPLRRSEHVLPALPAHPPSPRLDKIPGPTGWETDGTIAGGQFSRWGPARPVGVSPPRSGAALTPNLPPEFLDFLSRYPEIGRRDRRPGSPAGRRALRTPPHRPQPHPAGGDAA